MDIKSHLDKLYSLHTFGVKLGLENISKFLKVLGNPQEKFKSIHIAGSNGKGSTAAFISSILIEFGYKVGLYTSPHFVRFNERVRINNIEIPDSYIAEFLDENFEYIIKNEITFFEATTALAFKYFSESNLNYAVIETGLGGRLDATNVLHPLCSVITSLSYEHTEILGKKLEQIAYEKGEIIKENSKVFTGKLPPEAQNVIKKKCEQVGSKLFNLEDYIIEKNDSVILYTEELEIDDWNLPLKGFYQKRNAALASLVVSKILDTTDFRLIEKGIKDVVKNTSVEGRYEFYRKNPDVIFDSAHNPEGVSNFIREFSRDSEKYKKKYLLFSALRDKEIAEMLNIVKDSFDEFYITQINIERASKLEDLEAIAASVGIKTKRAYNPVNLIKEFENENNDSCLVVLGSMYLLGDIKSKISAKVT